MRLIRASLIFLCVCASLSAEASDRRRSKSKKNLQVNPSAAFDQSLDDIAAYLKKLEGKKFGEEAEKTQYKALIDLALENASLFKGEIERETKNFYRSLSFSHKNNLSPNTVLMSESGVLFFQNLESYFKNVQRYLFIAAKIRMAPSTLKLTQEEQVALIPKQLEDMFSLVQAWFELIELVDKEIKGIIETRPLVLKTIDCAYDRENIMALALPVMGTLLSYLYEVLDGNGICKIRQYLSGPTSVLRRAKKVQVSYQGILKQMTDLVQTGDIGKAIFEGDSKEKRSVHRVRQILAAAYWKIMFLDTENADLDIEATKEKFMEYGEELKGDLEVFLNPPWMFQRYMAASCERDLHSSFPFPGSQQDVFVCQNLFNFYKAMEGWVEELLPDLAQEIETISKDRERYASTIKADPTKDTCERQWVKNVLMLKILDFPEKINDRQHELKDLASFKKLKSKKAAISLLLEAEKEKANTDLKESKKTKEKQLRVAQFQKNAYERFREKKRRELEDEIQRANEHYRQNVQDPLWRMWQRQALSSLYQPKLDSDDLSNFQAGEKAYLLAWNLVQALDKKLDPNVPLYQLEVCVGLSEYYLAWLRHFYHDGTIAIFKKMQQDVDTYREREKREEENEWISQREVVQTLVHIGQLEKRLEACNAKKVLQDAQHFYEQSLDFSYRLWKQLPNVAMIEDEHRFLMEIPSSLESWHGLIQEWRACRSDYLRIKREKEPAREQEKGAAASSPAKFTFPTFDYLASLGELGVKLETLYEERAFDSSHKSDYAAADSQSPL